LTFIENIEYMDREIFYLFEVDQGFSLV